jgi:hypothetical protein
VSSKRVPNTITDRQMADLQRRARKANPDDFSAAAIRRRLATIAQQRKANQS